MKKILFPAAATVLFAASGLAQTGSLDSVACTSISGWASSGYQWTESVDIYDGATLVQANVPDSSWVDPVFSFTPPAALLDGRLHQIYAKFAGTQINLNNSPMAMQCSVSSRGYTYYENSTFNDSGNWNSYGQGFHCQ
jgi:hypothetical protein